MLRWLLISVGLFAAAAARAQPTLGDGHLGQLEISTPDVQLNRYLRLERDAELGALTLSSVGDLVSPGDLLLLIEMRDDLAVPADLSSGTVDLRSQNAGRYAWARVASVSGGELTLSAPLGRAFPSVSTQVVVTPEYTRLTVLDGGSIIARPWDGYTGGVVSLVAQLELTNEGLVQANGSGLRGGVGMPYQVGKTDGSMCHELVEPFPLGSMVGEGLASGWGAGFGRGPTLLGGGGGGCIWGGGAGGSLIGRGGRGGDAFPGADNGGLSSAPVVFLAQSQLLLGGGGGAGWSSASYSTASVTGGRGGGAIMVHAAKISGAGRWSANGSSPAEFGGGDWGYGGGGAGGSVVLRGLNSLECGAVTASGARGGRSPNEKGPGGGGGGGLVFLESAGAVSCPASAIAGLAGVLTNAAMPDSQTAPGYVGSVKVVPLSNVDGPPPVFLSTPSTTVFCGTPYRYSVERAPRLSTAGPFVFSLHGGDEGLPASLSVNEETGEILWRPTKAQAGSHQLTLVATSAGGTASQTLNIVVECEDPSKAKVGCACSSASPATLGLLALGALARRLLRRGRAVGARSI